MTKRGALAKYRALRSEWLLGKSCKRCGRSLTGRGVTAVFRHRRGLSLRGVWKNPTERRAVLLAESDIYCQSCCSSLVNESRWGLASQTPEEHRRAIEDCLLGFHGSNETRKLAHADCRTVRAVLAQLQAAGHTCGCGRKLAHRGAPCSFVRSLVRGAPQPVAPRPIAQIDSSRCSHKACPFPAVANGECRQHSRFYELPSDLLGDVLAPWDFLATPDNPIPLLHLATRWELQHYQTAIYRRDAA